MCIDLHTHSIYSDGTVTPDQLIALAKDARLQAIALTDHDTVAGIEEFMTSGNKSNILTISGLEVSALHQEFSLHILGYGIDHQLRALQNWLTRLQLGRKMRNQKILENLRQLGIAIDDKELQDFSGCGQSGRPHIAGLLVRKKVVKNREQAFSRYLRKGGLAWADRFAYSAEETIKMIHQAGGIAVLAHPGQIDPAMEKQPDLIAELVHLGLDGLEIYYPNHSRKMQDKLRVLAATHQLLITGGSDFHGNNKPGSRLAFKPNGDCPPDSLIGLLMARLSSGIQK